MQAELKGLHERRRDELRRQREQREKAAKDRVAKQSEQRERAARAKEALAAKSARATEHMHRLEHERGTTEERIRAAQAEVARLERELRSTRRESLDARREGWAKEQQLREEQQRARALERVAAEAADAVTESLAALQHEASHLSVSPIVPHPHPALLAPPPPSLPPLHASGLPAVYLHAAPPWRDAGEPPFAPPLFPDWSPSQLPSQPLSNAVQTQEESVMQLYHAAQAQEAVVCHVLRHELSRAEDWIGECALARRRRADAERLQEVLAARAESLARRMRALEQSAAANEARAPAAETGAAQAATSLAAAGWPSGGAAAAGTK